MLFPDLCSQGSVCIGKISDDQVWVWMVTLVQAVLFFSSRFSVNDSFGLRHLTLIGDLGWLAGGTLRDQAKISTRIKSFSSQWWLAPARATSFKSFLRKFNKYESSSLAFLCYRD